MCSKWGEVPAELCSDLLCSAHSQESSKLTKFADYIKLFKGCKADITASSCRVTEQQKQQMKFNIREGKMMYPKK